MRVILFRGQTEAQKKWIFGDLMHSRHGGLVWIDNHEDGAISDLRVIPETVGQYTEMNDVDDNKIFEGDFIYDSDENEMYKVKFDTESGEWIAAVGEGFNRSLCLVACDCVIVGNIHDNPER